MYAFFLEKIENNKIRQNNKNALINNNVKTRIFLRAKKVVSIVVIPMGTTY